jgi:hypothetical protein
MPKILLLVVLFCCAALLATAQEQVIVKGDSLKRVPKVDTAAYVNVGKIAAKKAAWRSAIIPGWGQVSNGLNIYRGVKVAAIYTGGTLLAMSYISNNNNYHKILAEVQYRETHNGVSPPGSLYPTTSYETSGLIEAKDLYRRNREVVVLSFVALYGVNIIEAYIDARLKYFDIDNNLAIKISPSVIGSNTMYGYNSFAPALKIAFRL